VATDTDVPAQPLTYTVSGLPAAATVDGDIFRWQTTETDGGNSYTATVIVSDGVLTDSQSFTIAVGETNNPPSLVIPTGLTATEGVTFTISFTATDDNVSPGLTFDLANPPAGSLFDGNSGRLEWQPTEAQGPGSISLWVTVTDTTGLTDSGLIFITVNEVNQPPALAAVPPQVITVTELLTFTAVATDTDWPANVISYSLVSPPTGAIINPVTGVFSWTPGSPGLFTITVQAEDNGSPVLTNTLDVPVTVNGPVLNIVKTVTPTVVEPGDALTYTIVVANSGLVDAGNVRVQDSLPEPVEGSDLDETVAITAGDAVTFTLNAVITDTAAWGITITNTASFSYAYGQDNAVAALQTKPDTTPPTFGASPLISPTNGTTITNQRPPFRWNPATDDESGVVSYTLRITGSNDSFGIQAATREFTATEPVYTPTTNLPTGSYTWTVRAHDASGNRSDWVTPPYTFTITADTSPIYLPVLLRGNTVPASDLVIDDLVI
jgi:uncharacterized repeat protein (TIGR01451 family)